jgi:TolB-like protein/tetratricopeptide (TPR) repeat protein
MASDPSGSHPLGREFVVGDWIVRVASCQIVQGSKIRHLPPRTMDVLVALAENAGETVTKDELLDRVWADREVYESVLPRTIAELRQLLDDTAVRPRYVETVPKRGYRLLAAVHPWGERRPRIAVLPLANLSGPAEEFFADGLTDALITELARIEGLRVISRQSVLHLRGSDRTVPEIGAELGVDAVVEGTALRLDDRVRVTAQLITVRSEAHVWAERYEADAVELLALERRIAVEVAEAVRAGLGVAAARRARTPATVKPASHLAYLRARHLWGTWTEEGLAMGFAHLQEAITADPEFAPAYEAMAMCWTSLGYWGHVPIREAYPQARAAALRALELDPESSNTHVALGFIRWLHDWDLAGSEAEYRRALELAPSNEYAHLGLALFLVTVKGEAESCLEHAREALVLDPLSLATGFSVAWLLLFAGESELAVAQAEATLELHPGSLHPLYVLGWGLLAQGRMEEAVAAFERAVEVSDDPITLSYYGHALGRAGRREDAQRLLERLQGAAAQRYAPPFASVIIHAGLDDRDEAFAWLARCMVERDSRMFWLPVVPAFEPLRKDPRYAQLLRRLGV